MGAEIKRNEDARTVTITLARPFAFGDDEVRELTLRLDATVADLEAMDQGKGEMGKLVHFIAGLAAVSPGVIRKLGMADFTAVSEEVTRILGKDPSQIGATLRGT